MLHINSYIYIYQQEALEALVASSISKYATNLKSTLKRTTPEFVCSSDVYLCWANLVCGFLDSYRCFYHRASLPFVLVDNRCCVLLEHSPKIAIQMRSAGILDAYGCVRNECIWIYTDAFE